MDFAVLADRKVKLKESEKSNKYLHLARELKKTIEHEGDGDTNRNWCTRYGHQKIVTGTGGFGNKRTSGDHPNYSISRSARILRKVLKTWGDLLSSKLQWKTIGKGWCEKLEIIISEFSKLAQKKYKTRPDWVGIAIPWKLCNRLKLNHTNKWYMQNPTSVLENDTQTDHLISPDDQTL